MNIGFYKYFPREDLLRFAADRKTLQGNSILYEKPPEQWSNPALADRLEKWDKEHALEWQLHEPWKSHLAKLGRKSFDGSIRYDDGIMQMENALRHNADDEALKDDLRLSYKYYHTPSPPPLPPTPPLRPFRAGGGTVYRDRTLGGGVPTLCIGNVKLSKLTIDTDAWVGSGTELWLKSGAILLYESNAPSSCAKVGKGAYGDVYVVSYPSSGSIILKDQGRTPAVVENMRVAVQLKACNLVHFRFFEIDGIDTYRVPERLWTAMEKMTDDCSKLSSAQRDTVAPDFGSFVKETLECLLAHGGSFPDMKLQNCGYKYCADSLATGSFPYRTEFRLIDLDGINGTVATFPISDSLTINIPDNQKPNATRYAFAVTAALFVLNEPAVNNMFYYTRNPSMRLAPTWERQKVLEAAVPRVPGVIADLIKDHALPFL
jgi:hypothetical protein